MTRGTPGSSIWPAIRCLLGQREGRTGAAVIDWLAAQSAEFRAAVKFVAIDPAAVYATAIRTCGLLPTVAVVVDHFHLVKLANDAVTKVRRRVTWELRERRGRKLDPEWANRRRLLRARERLSPKSFATMWNAIIAEDPSGQILSAWIAKEELRTLLCTVRLGGDPHLTRHRLHRSCPGASTRRSPNCSPWPPPSTPGGPKSRASSPPASPTPAPRATTGWSNTSNAPLADSETPTTRPAGHHSTATCKQRTATQT